ncbi:MAG TPA: hypothetical protein PKC12_07135 [Thiobacillaceae bacterium]|nr:hypothetical protein [Thiobacillaceae bacterium]
MKSTLIKQALGLLALGLVATGTQAGWADHERVYDRHSARDSRAFSQEIQARQMRQMERIEAGHRNGALTRGEYRRLMAEQREIRDMKHRFRADGRIDGREFRRLERALDVANQNIRASKHERHARNTYGYRRGFN